MHKIVYLDNAATSWPKPPEVAKAMLDFIQYCGGNPGRSGHRLSIDAARLVNDCRLEIAELFGVCDPGKVVFSMNASYSMNLALRSLAVPGCRIVSTMMEHNSVARVLESLRCSNVDVQYCHCDNQGFLDLDELVKLLRTRTHLVVINHASNVTGSIQDLEKISMIVKESGALVIVDAAQTAGITDIDVTHLMIDALVFTGHKGLFGPQGTGGIVFSDSFNANLLCTVFAGGTGSKSESTVMPKFLPDMMEPGTLNCPGIAGLLEGVRFVKKIGVGKIHASESILRSKLIDGLKNCDKINVYGSSERSTGVLSFTIQGMDNSNVGSRLDEEFAVLTRFGLHCAPLAHKTINTFPSGTVRISTSWFTTHQEIDQAIEAILKVAST